MSIIQVIQLLLQNHTKFLMQQVFANFFQFKERGHLDIIYIYSNCPIGILPKNREAYSHVKILCISLYICSLFIV